MYMVTLAAHNILRWVVVVLAAYALVRMFAGLFGKKEFTETDRKSLSFYTISMDIQLLIGLLLYFVLSPITTSALGNFGAAMRDSNLRFFAVEHISVMIVAVILAHVASMMVKRATTSASKFRRGAIWGTLSVLALLFAIPWWRPLLPHAVTQVPALLPFLL
jgi:hypothetical protein